MRRLLATETAAKAPTPSPPPTKSGGGIFQRLTSFTAGAGLMALGTQFYIYREIQDGNKAMISRVSALEMRLANVEKK